MKNIFAIVLCLVFGFGFSQVKEPETVQPQAVNDSARVRINRKVDSPAEFPGGMNAFRRAFSRNFSISRLSGKIRETTKTEAQFLIDTEGNISSIIVTGDNPALNKEMERVLKSIKTKWKPAMYKDQPVEYHMRLPLILNY